MVSLERSRHRLEVLELCLVRSRDEDGRDGESVCLHGCLDSGASPGDLLADDRALDQPEARSTVLLGDVRVEKTEIMRLSHQRPGILLWGSSERERARERARRVSSLARVRIEHAHQRERRH